MSANDGSVLDVYHGQIERTPTAMTFPREPQHDQAVQQHRQRRRPLDRRAASSLAAPRSPSVACCRGCVTSMLQRIAYQPITCSAVASRARRVERLLPSSALARLRRRRRATAARARHARGPLDPPDALVRCVRKSPRSRGDSDRRASAWGVGSRSPRLRGRPFVPGFRSGGAAVQPRIFQQPAGQIAIRRQDSRARSGRRRRCRRPRENAGFSGGCTARSSISTANSGRVRYARRCFARALLVQVQAEQDRQAVVVTRGGTAIRRSRPARPNCVPSS